MPNLPTPDPFVGRFTPAWFVWLSDYFVLLLLAFWAAGVWLVFQLGWGARGVAAVLAPIWLVLAGLIFFWLHRAGRVRLAVSVSATLIVLAIAILVGGRGL
jgi:hypothetical protein